MIAYDRDLAPTGRLHDQLPTTAVRARIASGICTPPSSHVMLQPWMHVDRGYPAFGGCIIKGHRHTGKPTKAEQDVASS